MKNIKAIALSLLSVMIGACNITNASNSQHDNTLGDINNNTIYEIIEYVEDNYVVLFAPGDEPIDDIYREIVTRIYKASNNKSLNTITKLVNETIDGLNEDVRKGSRMNEEYREDIKFLDQNKVSEILKEIMPN